MYVQVDCVMFSDLNDLLKLELKTFAFPKFWQLIPDGRLTIVFPAQRFASRNSRGNSQTIIIVLRHGDGRSMAQRGCMKLNIATDPSGTMATPKAQEPETKPLKDNN